MGKVSKLAKLIANKARQQRLDEAEKARQKKKRQKERDALALANLITPDGFHPAMRAKLQDASKRANEDPRARALVEQASLRVRVEQLRREKGIGVVAPPLFMGEPADERGLPLTPEEARARVGKIPASVGEMREKETKK